MLATELSDAVKVRVHRVSREGRLNPLLASFAPPPGGEDEDESSCGNGNSGGAPGWTFSVSSTGKRGARRLLLARGPGGVLLEARSGSVGSGGDMGIASADSGSSVLMLGIFSSKRSRVDLYPIEGGAAFAARPVATGTGAGSDAALLAGLSVAERRDLIIADFASSKKQRMEKSRKANIVDVGAVAALAEVEGTLRGAAASAGGTGASGTRGEAAPGLAAAKVEASLLAARRASLPAFDLDAVATHRVYPLESLLGGSGVYAAVARESRAFVRKVRGAAAATAGEAGADVAAAVAEATAAVVHSFAKGHYVYFRDRLATLALAVAAAGSSSIGDDYRGGGAAAAAMDGLGEIASADDQAPAFHALEDGSLPVHARLCCLFRVKHLLDLLRAPTKLRFSLLRAPGSGGAVDGEAGAAGQGNDAVAADVSADKEEMAAAPRLGVRQLRFIPESVVEGLLAAFTEARADAQAAEAATSLAAGAIRQIEDELGAESGRAPRGPRADVPSVVYVRTGALTDKLLAHIAALALAVDGYATELRLLAADTQLSPEKLARTFRELGCVVKRLRASGNEDAAGARKRTSKAAAAAAADGAAVGDFIASLTAPVAFPKAKLARNNGR